MPIITQTAAAPSTTRLILLLLLLLTVTVIVTVWDECHLFWQASQGPCAVQKCFNRDLGGNSTALRPGLDALSE